MNDEARTYVLFQSQNFPMTKDMKLRTIREQCVNICLKANEKLIGTFKGIEEERKIKVDENTGKTKLNSGNRYVNSENVQKYQLQFIHQRMLIKIKWLSFFMVEVTRFI